MEPSEMTQFIKEVESSIENNGEDNIMNQKTFNCEFTDMKISDIGYGKGEYKTSKPNILKNESVIEEILNVSKAAETAIGHTIGPYGDASLVQTYAHRDVPVYNTRDGYTILQNMSYSQPIPNAIFKIIREASEYMQYKIGDSTSSGIPIQNSFLTKLIDIFNKNTDGKWVFSPIGIRNISKFCITEIHKAINNNPVYQKSFDDMSEDEIIKWLTKVATTSANNDYETGRTIAELYRNKLDGRGNVISVKSKTDEEWVEERNAFVIPIGLFDTVNMANSEDRFFWKAEKPLIAMFDGNLEETDLDSLKQIVQTVAFDLKRPLMIICSQLNIHVANYLYNCIQGTMYNALGQEINDPKSDPSSPSIKLNISAIIVRNKHIEEQYLFNDIKLMTGSKVFITSTTKLSKFSEDREVRKGQLESLFGTCELISSGYADTNFVGCQPDKKEFDSLISDLEAREQDLKNNKFHTTEVSVSDIKQRIDRLQSRTTFYHCGGASEAAKYSRQLIIDDAIASVAATIKNGGVSLGCNMSICHYIHHHHDELMRKIVDEINNVKINITAAENYNTLMNIVSIILEAIEYSFGSSYRYAMYNMYRDPKQTMKQWLKCLESETPIVYNIMTNQMEQFVHDDVDKCTSLIVPKDTDKHLMQIIIESVGQLINIGNMITLARPNLDLEAIQDERLKNFNPSNI